jgi:hypothetical protein
MQRSELKNASALQLWALLLAAHVTCQNPGGIKSSHVTHSFFFFFAPLCCVPPPHRSKETWTMDHCCCHRMQQQLSPFAWAKPYFLACPLIAIGLLRKLSVPPPHQPLHPLPSRRT